MREISELLRIAKDLLASNAEKEVERFLGAFLPKTPWAGKVFSVGGYNRDELLGLDPKDLDLVVELPSEKGKRMPEGAKKFTEFMHGQFPAAIHRPFQTGAAYPIWMMVFDGDVEYRGETYGTKGASIDVADTMKESFPDAESRQRNVEWGTRQEDVERRDFTVNSLLKDMTSGEFIDLTGVSMQDIKEGVLRGNPMVSMDEIFRNDPLRMIRLVRFQAKYGWTVPMSVLKAVRRNAQRIEIVSAERIMGELTKLMTMGKLAQGIKMMKATGLLKYVFPEIEALRGVSHEYSKGMHQEGDVLRHTLLVLKNAKPGIENQLAALLHDVGKPETRELIDGFIRFLGHEKASGEIAEGILRRLKFDLATVKKVRTIVENHMVPHHFSREDVGDRAIRRFVREVGEETANAIFDLAEADEKGNLPVKDTIPKVRERLEEVMRSPIKVQKKAILGGYEIMDALGISKDDKNRFPEIGRAQTFLLELADERASEGKELTKEEALSALRSRSFA